MHVRFPHIVEPVLIAVPSEGGTVLLGQLRFTSLTRGSYLVLPGGHPTPICKRGA